jgi:hypothetical protein
MTGKRRKVARNTGQKSKTGSQMPPNHRNTDVIPSKSRFPEVSRFIHGII